jgi:hypothetical protein
MGSSSVGMVGKLQFIVGASLMDSSMRGQIIIAPGQISFRLTAGKDDLSQNLFSGNE